MCLPFLNLSVRYDALLRAWCVAYAVDESPKFLRGIPEIEHFQGRFRQWHHGVMECTVSQGEYFEGDSSW
jgi:hypothetical protein